MSAPILAYPQFHGEPFILDTDFSADPGTIGGMLSQVQDGQEQVIAWSPGPPTQGTKLCIHKRGTTHGNLLPSVQ